MCGSCVPAEGVSEGVGGRAGLAVLRLATVRRRAMDAFVEAAGWYAGLVPRIAAGKLDGPGLGEWSLRELVAHGSRALTTVVEYFRTASSGAVPEDDSPIESAGAYFLSVHDNAALHRDVAERGRREAAGLGGDLSGAVAARAGEAVNVVRAAAADSVFETRLGAVGFATYLCTRTVELVVHGIDVCAAADIDADVPDGAAALTLEVMADLSRRRGDTVDVVRALAGRANLPENFSLFT